MTQLTVGKTTKPPMFPSAFEIVQLLDQHIVGQREAKSVLATSVYRHFMLRAHADETGIEVDTRHKNILLVGPTGSGKTEVVRQLAKCLGTPFAYMSATALTQEGYIGKKPTDIIRSLLQAANNDVRRAEYGIVFLDEVDKIRRCPGNDSLDVGGEGVQISLLPFLDGAEIELDTCVIDTRKVFVVAAGAFQEFFESKSLPFTPTPTVEQLAQYGLLEEFIGRFSQIVGLSPLTANEMATLLKSSGVLRSLQQFFLLHDVILEITDDAALAMAHTALRRGTGARGLAALLHEAVQFFELTMPFCWGHKLVVQWDAACKKVRATKDEPLDHAARQSRDDKLRANLASLLANDAKVRKPSARKKT